MRRHPAREKGSKVNALAGSLVAIRKAVSQLAKGKEKVLITFHSLGDMDACASALALASHIGKKAMVCPPDRVNSESRRVLGKETAKFTPFSNAIEDFQDAKVVLLDCNDRSLAGHVTTCDLLIDHHAMQRDSIRGQMEYVDPESSSTSEIIAMIIGKPAPYQADLLIYGILSDSARLSRATPRTFEAMALLLKRATADYEGFLTALEKPQDAPGRAAVLEGLRNATWQEKGGLVAACAAVSSHESHVAEALVRAGADCAFAGTSGSGCRISARMRPAHSSRVDLPHLMAKIGRLIGGHGGGHPAAAGASGTKDGMLDEALGLAMRDFFIQANKL